MRTRVTAILVVRHGGEWLDQTLAGLAAQTRAPDRVIAVVNSGRESVAQQLRTRPGIDGVVSTQSTVPFGAAVQHAVAAIPAAEPAEDWYWLLTEDSAPEPLALSEILKTVQRAPSVAIAGPKLVSWEHPDRIIELGQSLTYSGDRWLLRRQERDQQQYDHLQDVLGVGPVGMLVRADAWWQLEGFDPGYHVYDDGLDLSVRARLAGFRVVVAPTSRIRFAQLGVGGPRIERSRRVLRAAHREARTAQLHRRISYANGFAAFFMWLALPILALLRVAWALIREQPGNMWGEFSSALRVFFRPGSIRASRRRVRDASKVGWSAVRPLRVDQKTVRTARMIDREAILVSQGRLREDLHFVSTGGLAVLLFATVVTIVLTWWAISQTSLTGGALAPLSPLAELWANTRIVDGVPADPFTWVLAVLGTLTFWNPSHAIVLFLVAAIPLAALGGWIWAAQLTKTSSGRALVALAWAFSPVLLGSLAAGRLPTLILAVVLPWLLLAATRARSSWSWAGTASLLAAVALACAPVLIPAAVVLLIAGLFTSPRGIARVLSVALAPLVLFGPKLLLLLRGGNPLDLLLDPGIVSPYRPSSIWQLLLGFPKFGLDGWGDVFDALGLGGLPAVALVGVLLLPIVLLAALGIFTGKVHFTVLHAVLGGVGLLTAVAASKLQLLSLGAESVALWTGSGLALYWIAVLGLAAVGTTALRRGAAPVAAVGVVLAFAAVAPIAVKLATANTGLVAGSAQMPAIVQAAGVQDPAQRTLVLTAQGERAVRAEIVTGPGVRLDQIRTADLAAQLTAHDEAVAELVATLASTGNSEGAAAALADEDVSFVLLRDEGESVERSQLQSAFDKQTALESAGQTVHGLLWRANAHEAVGAVEGDGDSGVDGAEAEPGADAAEGGAAGAASSDASTASAANLRDGFGTFASRTFASLIWWVQVVVLLGILLLALPTGEVVERPERRRRTGASKAAPETAPASDSVPVDESSPGAEPVPDGESGAEPPPATETAPAAEPTTESSPAGAEVSPDEAPDAGDPAVPDAPPAPDGSAPAAPPEPYAPPTPWPAPSREANPMDRIPEFLRPAQSSERPADPDQPTDPTDPNGGAR